ncbi:hypothetical protein CDAR_435051 [Caerostris darwini]|uniref:Uncharacterized protein n=1 Tax=Caerostris darwini TaxID=1538125 RepID=A0AAV4UIF1_9ARAC|nr:hypothetical protein CDAR_435051 [Caerostris darwini]
MLFKFKYSFLRSSSVRLQFRAPPLAMSRSEQTKSSSPIPFQLWGWSRRSFRDEEEDPGALPTDFAPPHCHLIIPTPIGAVHDPQVGERHMSVDAWMSPPSMLMAL